MARTSRSRLLYGQYEFSPVPQFSWDTTTVRDATFNELFLRNTLNFAGTILTPASQSGQLDFILEERDRLQNALASGNQELIIYYDDVPVLSGIYPRINDVTFAQDVWVNRLDYTFTAEYDENFFGSGIQSFSETWGFEESEDRRSATARHDVNAVGLDTSDGGPNNAFENARTYVLSRTGYNKAVSGTPAFVQVSGISFDAYEELRSETVDVQNGSFGVSENFILSSGNFTHVRTSTFNTDEEGVTSVSFDGTIRGLGRGDVGIGRATSAWNDRIKPNLAGDASGVYSSLGGAGTLFTQDFISVSLTRDEFLGTLAYNVSYNDSASENLPSGISDFTINVQDQEPVKLFASFAIPERSLGNVIQDIGTTTEGQFTITGTAVGKADFPFADLLSYVEDRVNEQRPDSSNYQTLRLQQKSVTKDELNNTVNFNLQWIYTVELSQAAIDGQVTID